MSSLTTRQSACYVIRRLNELHLQPNIDPAVIDPSHCLNLTDIGIKVKCYDGNFLDMLSDLLEHKDLGPTLTLGKHCTRAIPYFINSVKYNLNGTNAQNKVQRGENVMASLRILTTVAFELRIRKLDYAKNICGTFQDDVKKALDQIKGEILKI